MDTFVNEKDFELLSGDRYTFAVLDRILREKCDLVLSDHRDLILCHSEASRPVWIWTPDGAPQPEIYDWLPSVLAACGPKNPRIVALAAGFQLLDFAGMGLSFDSCAVSGAPITGDAYFSAEEGGALSLAAAVNIAKKRPYPEGLRTLLSTLSVIDWASPPAFTAKRSEIEAGESLLVSHLQETFGHSLRSLRFIRQLSA